MIFGEVPLDRALGAILAHSLPGAEGRLRKGRVLDTADLAALAAAGETRVTVARLEPGDLGEDAAAARLAAALVPDPVAAGLAVSAAFTGRVNLNAVGPGIVEVDPVRVHALNRVDPAITLATLAPFARVTAGALVGTVKIIAYAVAGAAVERACLGLAGALRVRPVVMGAAGLVLTEVPGQDPKLAAKGRRAVEGRLKVLGMRLAGVETVAHDEGAIAAALGRAPGEMVLVLTGSATSDLHDTAPEGVRRAGGRVERFGMPVDPGNLLFLGHLGARPVVGLPGCARSPALNGADWVLERLACGLEVTGEDIAAMGVGGLLKEIRVRPQPREPG
ncbi:molybdopterin-binding protein [Neotabrizicola shimadae]|uniref:Molybdopterin-binding protein n=1 Tax=Neotabrizicola shimadae TaxID=2807096 RepID=A0A8G0ZZQ1_9RHOB|nr:molybdopterin-binding protein [Neotabrizicola shimadae]QYZ71364.1 molybdopterin-binding protein [Neotabrizicola shimadae]